MWKATDHYLFFSVFLLRCFGRERTQIPMCIKSITLDRWAGVEVKRTYII